MSATPVLPAPSAIFNEMELAARRNWLTISLFPFGRRRITLITYSVIQPTFDRLRAFHDKTYLLLIGAFRNKFPVSEREQV
ncbi:MAG: hypothetical protein NTV65_00835, partial [Proteobacteria bacterium]|nr:hypothetical protein [Pseudomonadota bacterium]